MTTQIRSPTHPQAKIKSAVPADSPDSRLGRRTFLGIGAALTGSLALGAKPSHAQSHPASPPADAPWSQSIGPGVVDRPYGRPAEPEAGVIRRNVPWSTR